MKELGRRKPFIYGLFVYFMVPQEIEESKNGFNR